MKKSFPVSVLFATFVALTSGACGSTVALEDRPCPCADGWQCCATKNVCVAPGAKCPSVTVGHKSDAGNDALEESGPIVLARAQSARCMGQDSDHVYWQNADGLVVGVHKTSRAVEVSHFHTPLAQNPHCGIVADGEDVFTTSYDHGRIYKLNTRSAGPDYRWEIGAGITQLADKFDGPSSIAVDAEWIYVAEYDGGKVSIVPRSSLRGATALVTGIVHPGAIQLDKDYVYFTEFGSDTGNDAADGSIWRVSKTGGDAVRLASAQTRPNSLALLGSRLYWGQDQFDGSVWGIDGDGKNLSSLAPKEIHPAGIAAMPGILVWTTNTAIRTSSQTGAGVRSVANTIGPRNVLVDDNRIYWDSLDTIMTIRR